jgi:hypothetical protein
MTTESPMQTDTLPETTHFHIVHHPGNIGTRWKQYSVQPKREKTGDSKALVPMPASADSPELLIDELQNMENWYAANRLRGEQNGRK